MKFYIIKAFVLSLAIFIFGRTDDSCADFEISDINTEFVNRDGNCSILPIDNECPLPRQTSISNAFRTYSQAKRTNNSFQHRSGYALAKSGKNVNPFTSSMFSESMTKFPSGFTESTHHLISLGKLII